MSEWRYRCPNGHVNIYKRVGGENMHGQTAKETWYCDTCKNYHDNPHYDHVIDAKTGKKVFP